MKVHGVNVSDSLAQRWKQAQSHDKEKYDADRENPIGVFSVPELTSAMKAGEIINSRCSGLILDVGCGCYHRPSYMQDGNFIGIDPFECGSNLSFPSAQAIGECLPFADNSFDAVTMMSVVDHFLDLDLALSESKRVLRNKGTLFAWFLPLKSDDYHHCQILSLDNLYSALQRCGFVICNTTPIRETAFLWDSTYLVETKKEK